MSRTLTEPSDFAILSFYFFCINSSRTCKETQTHGLSQKKIAGQVMEDLHSHRGTLILGKVLFGILAGTGKKTTVRNATLLQTEQNYSGLPGRKEFFSGIFLNN